MREFVIAGCVAGALLLCGCPGSTAPSDAGDSADAGQQDAGPDSGTALPGLQWTTWSPFPLAVDNHASFILDAGGVARLFVIGGETTGLNPDGGGYSIRYHRTEITARILADGGLGPFETTNRFSGPLTHQATAVAGGEVFLAGGGTIDAVGTLIPNGTVIRAGPREDGGLRGTGAAAIPQIMVNATAEVVGGWLFLAGGADGFARPQRQVWAARVDDIRFLPDGGVPMPFLAQAPLPEGRAYHAMVASGGSLYVVGGLGPVERAPLTTVLRSLHDASGQVVGWYQVGTLLEAPWALSAFVYESGLWVVGGVKPDGSDQPVERVRRAPLNADGTLGEFVDVGSPLPQPRGHVRQTPVHEGLVYSIGGIGEGFFGMAASVDQVTIGRLGR